MVSLRTRSLRWEEVSIRASVEEEIVSSLFPGSISVTSFFQCLGKVLASLLIWVSVCGVNA